jgi:F-type H+-transporting ATPase subunit a
MSDHTPRNPLDPKELFGHVEDSTGFHVPRKLAPADTHGHIEIPQPFKQNPPLYTVHTGNALIDKTIQPLDLKITKFMVIELVAAILLCVFFIGLAKALHGGMIARGRFRNMLEAMLLYFRDNVARPCIGHHDADRFVPFLWTIFFFVLACNLFGILPWMGSPTGSLAVTGALAFVTFLVVVGSGMKKLGAVGFWKAQVPHMDLSPVLKVLLVPMIFAIELFGLLVKHGVLAVRLLANMMGGHVVLAVIMAFIGASAASVMWYVVAPASVLGATALTMLELFVAFLQAYIFTFLSALFIGMAVHPH